jgi:hypothetical protein
VYDDVVKRKNPHAKAMGKLGGKARARVLTDDQRKAIARMGGLAKAAKARTGVAGSCPPLA